MARHPSIDRDLIQELAPANLGCTSHFNHAGCPAGEDTRGRLYITRTEDNKLLAYCHNCGGRGYVGPKGVTNIRYGAINDHASHVDGLFDDILKDPNGIPSCFTLWTGGDYLDTYLAEYELIQKECEGDGWMWSSDGGKNGSIVFPSFKTDGKLMGLQFKRLDKDVKPKCMTYGKMGHHIYNPNDSNHVVIVEDRISAVKITAKAGAASMCLHGASELALEGAHKVAMMFDYATVWFDNDNDTVRHTARMNLEKLRIFMGDRAKWHSAIPSPDRPKVDPKNWDLHHLKDIVTWPTRL